MAQNNSSAAEIRKAPTGEARDAIKGIDRSKVEPMLVQMLDTAPAVQEARPAADERPRGRVLIPQGGEVTGFGAYNVPNENYETELKSYKLDIYIVRAIQFVTAAVFLAAYFFPITAVAALALMGIKIAAGTLTMGAWAATIASQIADIFGFRPWKPSPTKEKYGIVTQTF